jgi:DnaJ domain
VLSGRPPARIFDGRTVPRVDSVGGDGLTLALQWHPDKVATERRAEAEEVFKNIKEAYDVLSDGTLLQNTFFVDNSNEEGFV